MTANLPLRLPLLPTEYQRSWHQHLWDSEDFFAHTDDYFQSLFDGIAQAQHSIIVATYIFDFDHLGKHLIDLLGAARDRGLTVQVLLDGVGSMASAAQVVESIAARKIDVRIYHPLPWQPLNYSFALRKSNWLANFISCSLKINQRHHAKVCIVDQQYLWTGSQNISVNHLTRERGGHGWHDYGVRVSGSAVATIANVFEDFWHYRKPRFGKGVFVHYLNNITSLMRRRKNRLLTDKIDSAQEFVWIINPYFSPTRSIVRALKDASQRGVDVRIIVPNKSDIEFFPLLTAMYYAELIKAAVRVFEYLPSILHAKLLMADDFRLIGSTNLNHRSLLHDIEFDIVLDSDPIKSQTRASFLRDQAQCREVTPDDLTLFGWRRLLGWVPWLLRYWL